MDELLEHWRMAGELALLPGEEADLLRRRFYLGQSQTEIAAATGLPLGTVKSRMVSGLRRLREALEARRERPDRLPAGGARTPAETAAFERAMAADATLRDEVERLRPVVTRLERLPAEAWEDVRSRRRSRCPPGRAREWRLAGPRSGRGRGCCAAPRGGAADVARREAARPRTRRAAQRGGGGAAVGGAARPLVLRPLVAAACAIVLLAAGAGLGFLLDREPSPVGAARAAAGRRLSTRRASGKVSLVGDGVNVRVSGLKPDRRRPVLRAVAARRRQAARRPRLVPRRRRRHGHAAAAAAGRPEDASRTSTSRSSPPTATPATRASRCCADLAPPERAELVERDRVRRTRSAVSKPAAAASADQKPG